jgi:3-hydroxypropanoate dehydrogenase
VGTDEANLPARLFLRTKEAKERLRPALMEGTSRRRCLRLSRRSSRTTSASSTRPSALPHYPAIREMFANSPKVAEETAFRNGTLQGAY